MTVLKGLQPGRELIFILNPLTFSLIGDFKIPTKGQNALKLLPQETVLREAEFNHLLNKYLPSLGDQQVIRIREAAAIAFYDRQTDCPVIQTLCCDDAPQFNLITTDRALCWVHEGRHYKKLSPVFHCHQVILEQFLDNFWDYSRELLAYKDAKSLKAALLLRSKFKLLFETPSYYKLLEERQQLTATKVSDLLRVLKHPELPLHNNPAALAARTMVRAAT